MNINAADLTPASSHTTGELTLHAGFTAQTSSLLERCAGTIECARNKMVEAIFDIGAQLQIAHDQLAHHGDGLFGKWVVQRCGMSRSVAHERYGIKSLSIHATATPEPASFVVWIVAFLLGLAGIRRIEGSFQ